MAFDILNTVFSATYAEKTRRREDGKTGRREDDKTRKREDDAVEKKLSMNCSSKDDCVTNTIHSKLRVIIH